MSELSPEVAAFLIMAAAVSVGFLIGWCVQPDNSDEAESMLRRADKQARTRIRLGRRTWRNFWRG